MFVVVVVELFDNGLNDAPFDVFLAVVEFVAESLPSNAADFPFLDGVNNEFEGVVFIGVRVEDAGDSLVDTPFEAIVEILVGVCEGIVIIASDVDIGMSCVALDVMEVLVCPVVFGEQASCMFFYEVVESVSGLVVLLGEM